MANRTVWGGGSGLHRDHWRSMWALSIDIGMHRNNRVRLYDIGMMPG